VHELGRDGATIYGAGFGGVFAGQVEFGVWFGLELTERVKVGLEISPSTESVEDPLPVFSR
jgi:hypothetical protein